MEKRVRTAIIRNKRIVCRVIGGELELPTYTLPETSDARTVLSGELNRDFGITRATIRPYTESKTGLGEEVFLVEVTEPLRGNGNGHILFDYRDRQMPYSLGDFTAQLIDSLHAHKLIF